MSLASFATIVSERKNYSLAVVVVALACTPLLAHVIRPTYEATAEVAFIGNPEGAILPILDLPDFVTSPGVIERAAHQLNDPNSFPIESLYQTTSAKIVPRSSELPIFVHSKDPQKAVLQVNAIAKATVSEYKGLARRQYTELIGKLQRQLAAENERIKQIDIKLQRTAQGDALAGSTNALDTISTRLMDLEAQASLARASLGADVASAAVNSGGTSTSDRSKLANVFKEQALAADPVYQAVRTAQAKDIASYEQTKAGYTDSFPGLAGLKQKVSLETASVDRITRDTVSDHIAASPVYSQVLLNQRAGLAAVAADKAKVASINSEIASIHVKLHDLPKYGILADQLRLERDSAATSYQQLQARLQQTLADQAQAGALASLVLMEVATTANPRIPSILMATLLALIIAALAIGAAFAVEALDPRIRTTADVESLYGSPHLGKI